MRKISKNTIKRKIIELKEIYKIPDSFGNALFEEILDIFEYVCKFESPTKFIVCVRRVT
jgi:hypothetical protein